MPGSQVSETSAADSLNEVLIEKVVVIKVFSSLSRPCMAESRRLTEGTSVDDPDLQNTIYPSLLIKKGNVHHLISTSDIGDGSELLTNNSVSYTHLTLPTILLV